MAAKLSAVKPNAVMPALLHARPAIIIALQVSETGTGVLAQAKLQKKASAQGGSGKIARKSRPWLGPRPLRWLKRGFAALLILALLPVVLTLVYALPFVHPVSTLMLKDAVTFAGYDRRWVELEDVAPILVHSVTMSEDGQFCSHQGIDLGALNEVISDALDGEPVRGASTITMQSVKNLYLWQGRSYLRKVLEAPLAVIFDLILPKKRIMEIYLNIVEWGPGIYGIEAAAQHHFGRPASKLTARQAALLAVTLPNPIERNPAKPTRKLNQLASIIQKRAQAAGSHVACFK